MYIQILYFLFPIKIVIKKLCADNNETNFILMAQKTTIHLIQFTIHVITQENR